jgi:hypothetical protein
MSPQRDLPAINISGVQEPTDQWPKHRHQRRRRRRFSRRKVRRVVRLTVIVALHVIAIAVLIYIWVKFAYSPGFTG